jgi:Beta-galactosidase
MALLRRRAPRVRARLLALIAAIAVMASAGQAQGAAPSGFFGVTTIFPPTLFDYAQMQRARVGAHRHPFGWSELEPVKGTYNFANFDRIVSGAAGSGMTMVPFIYGTPPWARNCSGIPDFYCDRVTPLRSAEGRQRWPQLLGALVDRYGPNGTFWSEPHHLPRSYAPVRSWQIWNEPNSATYLRPRPRPRSYYQLLKSASRAIRSRDPGARIILGGLFGTPPRPGIPLWRFLDRLYQFKKAKKLFSGVAVHPYSANVKGIVQQLTRTRRVMKENGDRKTPLFITELGWGSDPRPAGGSRLYKGLAGQSQLLRESFRFALKNRKRYRLRGVYWFSWRDLSPDQVGNCLLCQSFGLIGVDGVAKPALGAFAAFTGGQP